MAASAFVRGPRRGPLRARQIASGVVLAVLLGVGFVPLFGGPGYEHALASGIVVPLAAAVSVALDLSAGDADSPLGCVARGLGTGAVLAALAFLTALLHGLRVGFCDLEGGAVLFALTAGCGGLLGGVWGACVAEVCRRATRRRRLLAVLLAVSAPLAGIAVSVGRFYGSPMVFSYDPFFGYFSGTLYDTVVDVRPELWTYRAGTAATLAGAALLASGLARGAGGALVVDRTRGSWVRLALGLACLLASLGVAVSGPALGHWQTSSTLARALGGRRTGDRCEVFFPDSVLADQASLLLRDCEEQVAADEERLGAKLGGRLTEFVFRDADEKRRLMGAAETSIAKPWRREVYVQMAPYPHPILGHEIAHVVAGSFGRGPFRVAGSLGGLLPNPGLIEGVAVATSPDDDELTDGQWARGMLDLGILPPLRSLFSLGFLGENASKSYTAAGAFVGWVLERWGAPAVRAWYGGAPLEAVTGEPWGRMEDDFRAHLRSLRMPPEASAYAKARFERPSVWARRCPHVVDALDRDADRCRDDHRFARAVTLYDEALARDPHDWHALFARARVLDAFLDPARGHQELVRLAEGTEVVVPRSWRDRAREALADDRLARGDRAGAADSYRALAAAVVDEDVARTLEVKALAADDPEGWSVIVDLFVNARSRPVDPWVGALSLGRWEGETHAPLARYLIGKNLASREDCAAATGWLEGQAPTPRIGRELLRVRAVCGCAAGDAESLGRVERAVLAPGSPFEGSAGGRREWLLRLVARCRKA